MMALEARMLFDGALGVEIGTQATEALTADQAPDAEAQRGPDVQELMALAAAPAQAERAAGHEGDIEAGAPPSAEPRTEVVFVDPSVENYRSLIADVDPSTRVVILDGARDGVQQIAEALATMGKVDAIHLVSHGSAGQLQLGTAVLDSMTMRSEYAEQLVGIGKYLAEDADILVYGCDFGQGEAGSDAAMRLAYLTGADIAASDDLTGHAELGGDWDLELEFGRIETDVAFGERAQEKFRHVLATLDWDAVDWTANATSGTYAAGGVDVSISITGNTNRLAEVNDNTDLTGGTGEESLKVTANAFQNAGEYVELTIAFSDEVSNVSFSIFDIDQGAFTDRLTITGTSSAGSITPTSITAAVGSPSWTLSGNVITGSASAGDTTSTGTANVVFNATGITSITVRYQNTTPVANQWIGLHDVTFATEAAPVLDLDASSPNETAGDNLGSADYSGGSGAIPWVGDWIESDSDGDSQDEDEGNVRVTDTPGGGTNYGIRLSDSSGDGSDPASRSAISRTVDLSGYTNATLSYRLDTNNLDNPDTYVVEVSADGGATFTELASYSNDVDNTYTVSLAGYESANTVIRFRLTSNFDGGEYVYVDDVSVSAQPVGGWTNPTAYTEQGTARAFADSDTTITDADAGASISKAEIAVSNVVSGDRIAIDGTTIVLANGSGTTAGSISGAGGVSYTVSVSGSTATVTLAGAKSLAVYRDMLSGARYDSTSDDPTAGGTSSSRSFAVTVYDNTDRASNTATGVVNITAVDDTPTTASQSIGGTEDTVRVLAWGDFAISDVDTSDSGLSVQIRSLPGAGVLERWNGSAWVAVAVNDTFSKAAVDAGNLRFAPGANQSGADAFGTPGVGDQRNDYAQFTYRATDGSSNSADVTMTIDIAPEADVPTLEFPPPAGNGLTVDRFDSVSTINTTVAGDPLNLQPALAAATPTATSVSTTVDFPSVAEDQAYRITGLIYLEAGKTYTIGGVRDDTLQIEIGGTAVFSSGYNTWGSFTATPYTPAVSGYYTLEMYAYNGDGAGNFQPTLSVDGGSALAINSSNFHVYSTLAAVDAAGGSHDALVLGPDGDGGYYAAGTSATVNGTEDVATPLPSLVAALGADQDGSESLSVTIGNLPVGATLSDGTNTFTATPGNTVATVTSWNLSTLTFHAGEDANGSFALSATATATESANGDQETRSLTINVIVAPVNDAPDLDLNGGVAGNDGAAAFSEQTPVLIAPSGTLTDVDTANLVSLTATLASRPDGNGVESLSLNAAAAAAASGLTVTYTASTGVLSITGSASTATYQAILQGIQYSNTSDTPTTSPRTVNVVASDGTEASVVRAVSVSVAAVNDAPVFAGTAGGVTFLENGSPVALVSGAVVSDVDAANFSGGSLTVSFASYQSGDALTINDQGAAAGQIGVSGANVTYGGVTIGTFAGGGGADLVVSLNANASAQAVEALIGQLRYSSSSDNPTANGTAPTRALTVTLNDGGNSGSGGVLTASQSGTINITDVPESPAISAIAENAGGGINAAEAADGTPVVVTLPADVRAGDTVTVYWGSQTVNYTVTAGDVLGGSASVAVSAGTIAAHGDGTFDVAAEITDLEGQTGSVSSPVSVTVDTTAPAPTVTLTSSITADDIINIAESGGTVAITGTAGGDAQVGDTVTLTVNGVAYTGLVGAGNTFSINVAGSDLVADADFTIAASVSTTDAAGNTGTGTDTESYTVDVTAPAPVITSITDNVGPITGTVADGGVTNDTVLVLAGTAEANSTVTIYRNGTSVGTVTADGAGNWTYTTAPLADGSTSNYTARSTDGAGNTSASSATYSVTIDLTPPAAPTVSSLLTNDATPTISGTWDNAAGHTLSSVVVNGVTYTVGAALTVSGGTWTLAIPPGNALADGTYNVAVTTTDAAGNSATDATAAELVIDTVPPVPTLTLTPNVTADDIINSAESGGTVAITGNVGGDAKVGDTVTLTVNGATYTGTVQSGGTFSIAVPGAQLRDDADATIEASVSTTDAAGNTGTATGSASYTVDVTPPGQPTVNTLSTASTQPTLTGSYDAAGTAVFTVTVNGVTYTLGTDPALSVTGNTWTLDLGVAGQSLPAGASYEVVANATDAAGNRIADAASGEVTITAAATTPFTPPEGPSAGSGAGIGGGGGSGLSDPASPYDPAYTATGSGVDASTPPSHLGGGSGAGSAASGTSGPSGTPGTSGAGTAGFLNSLPATSAGIPGDSQGGAPSTGDGEPRAQGSGTGPGIGAFVEGSTPAGSGFPLIRVSPSDPRVVQALDGGLLDKGGHRLFAFSAAEGLQLQLGREGFAQVPSDAFAHTDPAAIVILDARMANGAPLPAWLSFDGVKGVFSGVPPAGTGGTLEIEIVARDEDGRIARAVITLVTGEAQLTDSGEAMTRDAVLGLDVDKEEAEKARREAAEAERQQAERRDAQKARAAPDGKPLKQGATTFTEQLKAARGARDPLLERIAKSESTPARPSR